MAARLRLLTLAVATALCAFAPLAIGTVHLWSIATASGLSLLLLVLVIATRLAVDRGPMRIGWVGAAFLVVTVWTAFQLIPLPPSWVMVLSPRSHEILEFTLGPLGLYGDDAWRPLSLDPPATAQELVRLAGLSAAYLAALNAFTSRTEANRLYTAVALTGAALFAIGVVHKLTGTRAILGLYESSSAFFHFFTSTFVNPNHLAGFLGLAAAIALGLASSSETARPWRWILAAAGVACGLGVLLSLSRAGIGALLFAQLVLAWLVLRRRPWNVRRLALLVGCFAAVAATGVAIGSERLLGELSPSSIGRDLQGSLKIELWRDSLPMVADFAGTGIGKGAFPVVFPLYQSTFAQHTFTHVENQILQILIDHGAVVGGFLLVTVAVAVARQLPRRLASGACGALAGVVGVAAHNLADFNLEVGGVAFPFALVLGTLLARPSRRELAEPARAPPGAVGTWVAAALVAGGLAALAVATPYAQRENKDRAVSRLRAAPSDPGTIEQVALTEIEHHPADYLLFLTAAARMSVPGADARRAIRFANRALYLNDASPDVHLVTARLLRAVGRRDQAILEYTLAVRRRPAMLERLFAELVTLSDPVAAMLEVAEGRDARRALARFLLDRRRTADGERVGELLLASDPADHATLSLLSRSSLARGDLDRALALADRLAAIPGQRGEAAIIAGDVHRAAGRLADARRAYELARSLEPRRADVYLRLAEIHIANRNGAEALKVLSELQRVDIHAAARPGVSMMLGHAWALEGRLDRAQREYQRVLEKQPGNAEAIHHLRALKARSAP
jgi:tetratricopeptide (TPR) repeat protein